MVDLNRNKFRGYAKAITDFPEADIQFEGIKAWILQGETHQLVFFQMEANELVGFALQYPRFYALELHVCFGEICDYACVTSKTIAVQVNHFLKPR